MLPPQWTAHPTYIKSLFLTPCLARAGDSLHAVVAQGATVRGAWADAFPATFAVGPLKKGVEQKIQSENAEC